MKRKAAQEGVKRGAGEQRILPAWRVAVSKDFRGGGYITIVNAKDEKEAVREGLKALCGNPEAHKQLREIYAFPDQITVELAYRPESIDLFVEQWWERKNEQGGGK